MQSFISLSAAYFARCDEAFEVSIIQINNLTKTYAPDRGVFDLTLNIDQGEIYGLLGSNGAGKTTALKMIAGLVHPNSGEIKVLGYDIKTEKEKALRYMGCILETAQLYPYLSAEENLKQVLRFFPELPSIRLTEVLQLVGMESYAKEKVMGFSLGMKQRIGLAMSLISHPKVLILDEPLNGLDIEGMVLMRNIFKQLAKEEQVTIIISSHLIHDVELTCDRIGIIAAGRLLRSESMSVIRQEAGSLESFFLTEVRQNARV
jgi:ABC-2 type transport system ATP-binding protein